MLRMRTLHKWVSVLVAVPFFVVTVTGILALTKDWIPSVQPVYQRVAESEVRLTFPQILEAARRAPEAGVRDWSDVAALDIRPERGLVRVRSKHQHWELQLHPSTGDVLMSAPRRATWLLELHTGAAFGPNVKYGVFLPSAVGVLTLLITGLWIFFLPILRRSRQ